MAKKCHKSNDIEPRFSYLDLVPILGWVNCEMRLSRRGKTLNSRLDEKEISPGEFYGELKKDLIYDTCNLALNTVYIVGAYYIFR